MRIWKRLLGLALCLCAAVCVMSVSASAAEHSNHPICGDTTKCTNPDHSGENHGGAVTWKAWNGTDEITYTDNTAYVYLKDRATRSNALKVSNGQTLNLCLNGKTLSSSNNISQLIEVTGGAVLNICSCQSGGEILFSRSGGGTDAGTPAILIKSGGKFNLYGGKVNRKNGSNGAGVKLYNAANAEFNMYGGEVCNSNDNMSAAVYANATSGGGTINIYAGTVICEKRDGISVVSGHNTQVLVAGGSISGGQYALNTVKESRLALSGQPSVIGGDAGIYLPSGSYFTVKNGFAVPKNGSISVMQALGTTNKGVIAKPEAGQPLADKAQYFVSAEEGYFVESNNDGDLQLTACAITEEPAVGNGYTVTANGSDDKVKYQWCSAKSGDVPVTDTTVTNEGSLNYAGERWSAYPIPSNGEVTGFTLTMKKDAVMALLFPDAEDIPGRVTINSASISDSTGNHTVHKNSSDFETVTETEWSWEKYKKCTITAPADGDYTLKISYVGDEGAYLQFTAKVTADVPNKELTGQVKAALDTSQLATGSYICQVTWENKTTRNSQAVRYTAASSHVHSWSTEWTSGDTHHWHECKNENCDVRENSGKSGYAEHSGGAANCTQQAVCTICGTAYGDFDTNGHDWGEWRVTKPATTSAAGEETRTCKRDASHTETRAIPKLTPAPSGGGSGSTPAVTVPVSGSGDTVHVSASVSGSTAEVKEIKSAELDKIGTDSAVVIDLSGLNKGVTGVTLSTDTIDSICKTEADGVTIKLPSAELRVDRQTLAAVAEQAAGSKLRLVVEPDSTARNTMTAAQKSTLAGMKNATALEAYFVSDGTRIHDFNGGEVELSIPYQASGALRAWFLKEDGTREPVSAHYDKENARLLLRHFSHYVIEELDSSAAYTVCAKDGTCPLAAFGDLTATAWYHDGVHYCLENGLMQGVSTAKFLPNGSTTRAQLAAILWRLEGSPAPVSVAGFSDVADGAWYAEAVRWAADSGVVKGYDSKHFGPDDAVTREQMVTILYRYAQYKGYDVSIGEDTNILSFDDAFAVSEYAIPAMQWACGSGLITGAWRDGGMALAPRDTATRAQTATLLTRFQSAFAKEP